MKKIIIASTNPVKIKATLAGFKLMFPREEFVIDTIVVDSGVGEQPMTDKQTLVGAINRILAAKKQNPKADFWVGIEGGVEDIGQEMTCFAWVVIIDKNGQVGKGKSGTIILPPKVAELVRSGMEMGEADDKVFHMTNSKQKMGAVGILTDNIIDRTKYYIDTIIFALIPFKNRNLY